MIRILELFGGIGACSKALERLGIDLEIADYVEIDKYAVKSFNAIHNTNFEPQDICEWDKDIQVDLIMHGSPCQDFSLAGKQAGGDKDSGTRSSLMYETIRIVEKLKPKYVIWENVKNLLNKKHRHNFDAYLETMEQLGYTNYYQVLNAKDYGIPQNRERVFTVSILGNESYEFPKGNECDNSIKVVGNYMPSGHDASRIIDENGLAPTVKENHGTVTAVAINFKFPPKQELKLKLKDMLEDEVDEKYYLSERMVNFFYKNEQIQKEKGNGFRFGVSDGNVIAKAVTTRAGGRMDDNFIDERSYLKIKNANKKGFSEAYDGDSVNLQRPNSATRRGRVGNQVSQTLQCCDSMGVVVGAEYQLKSKCKRLESLVKKTDFEQSEVLNMDLYNQTTNENISQTLTDPCHNTQRLFDGLRIRKLTPKECWRLMGFNDEDVDKAAQVNSNTQLYKQAGNSIVVNVLEAILKNLLLETEQDVPKGQMSIYDYIDVSNSKI